MSVLHKKCLVEIKNKCSNEKHEFWKKKKNDSEFNQNESILKNENQISNELKNSDWLIESIHVVELNFLK